MLKVLVVYRCGDVQDRVLLKSDRFRLGDRVAHRIVEDLDGRSEREGFIHLHNFSDASGVEKHKDTNWKCRKFL